jgi:hypothetical protein
VRRSVSGGLLARVNARKNELPKRGLRTIIDEHGLMMAPRVAGGYALMTQIRLGLFETSLLPRGRLRHQFDTGC